VEDDTRGLGLCCDAQQQSSRQGDISAHTLGAARGTEGATAGGRGCRIRHPVEQSAARGCLGLPMTRLGSCSEANEGSVWRTTFVDLVCLAVLSSILFDGAT